MNYVERHFGDWARDTSHLSMLEDGAYNRLCDLYYVREEALPSDLKACCRLVRAATKNERDAVESVLREFFILTEQGWTHRRCDIEIGKFRSKSHKASASANARWSKGNSHSDGNANAHANASPDAMRTHSEGNATRGGGRTRSHSPNTSNQTPDIAPAPPTADGGGDPDSGTFGGDEGLPVGHAPTPHGAITRQLRQAGIQRINTGNPEFRVLVDAGATAEEFLAFVPQALLKDDPWSWLLVAVRNSRKRAKATAAQLHRGPLPTAAQPTWKAEQQATTAAYAGRFGVGAVPPQPSAAPAQETIDVDARIVR